MIYINIKTLKTMKTFRIIGMALMAIMMCFSITACSSDDESASQTNSLVGTEWKGKNGNNYMVVVKITSGNQCSITV